jgi:ABC-type multidrug transport system permease subunit
MKNASSVSAITNPLTTFTTILPPIYYPLTLLPSSLRIFTLLVPTVSLMELGRFSLGYETGFGFVIPSLILCVWLAITSVLMTKKLSWGME